jgi:hypothetical protein
MSDINRQRDLAVGQTGDAAMRAGAFGGSRHGVAQAETERAYGDIAARTAAGLRGDAFNQAANLFGQDQQRMMQGAFGRRGNWRDSSADRSSLGWIVSIKTSCASIKTRSCARRSSRACLRPCRAVQRKPRRATSTHSKSSWASCANAGRLGWTPFSDARLKRDVEPLGKRGAHELVSFPLPLER